ncbi:VPLPA-CTERM sorting domain-containing protein [Rhodovulum tesquicola]|uniref:VPLPA-CTERM sorting domain-containing protein n=1 Tax=Rhodovulum tesquicola TaxID=540254 RepID=UPI002096AA86|nr:VPLPA-CTERM sorting domain-containing protein [Rhodovulum tesquicola]MCO8146199.1 VPLPA-CTERM sorting domain-containing protein [Rhodovulum tesquicola]
MKVLSALGSLAIAMVAMPALAATVNPTFSLVTVDTTNAQSSSVYKADLTGFPELTQIGSITVTDSNSGTGGSAGAYSGFDIDALFIDLDGDYTTVADQIYASSFIFNAGTVRAGSAPASNTSGALNGSNADGTVNEAFATLNAVDAIFFGTGSISLGDGGSLTANFTPVVPVGASLFLIASEVGTEAGEAIAAAITVRDTPVNPVPVPATLPLMLGALGVAGLVARRRKAA